MISILLRGYHPQKISGKINYINYLYRNQKTISIFHKLNPLNLIYPKATYLLKGMDLYLIYWPEVLLYLIWAKYFRKVKTVVIDSQENLFLVGLVRWLGFNTELILYDFAEPNLKISPKTSKQLVSFDQIVVMTEAIKASVVVQLPALETKIIVRPYKVQRNLFYPFSPEEAEQKAKLYGINFRYILYVGSEQDRKNFFTFVKAFRRLQKDFPDLYLVKIGQSQSAVNRAKLTRLLGQDPKLRDHFMLIENCSTEQLATYYNLAEIFIFPSLYEGFGIPLAEAMACGVPIVASRIPTTEEICGDAVLYVDSPIDPSAFEKSIKGVLKHPKVADIYRQKVINQAVNLSY